MTLAEKLGQLNQAHGGTPENKALVGQGRVGSLINLCPTDCPDPVAVYNSFQEAAVKGSRLGIPLIIGRDVIHGFRTMFPIPLGQAASFDPDLVCQAARVAATEAASWGINWTFAPMVDIARDPRWGRSAEGGGEDPVLASRMGAAMVRGFQGDDLGAPDSLAACAKHYVGYGAAEGGRDYNTTLIPEGYLRDVYLPPFRACVEAGAATLMSAFNDLNGVPASGNELTLRRILKKEWGFDGFVVSDWASIDEMISHGYCANRREAARAALRAGVDMEMVSPCYAEHLPDLVARGEVPLDWVDDAVRRILRIKFRLGLFDRPFIEPRPGVLLNPAHLATARRLAAACCVLLKNDGVLPLDCGVRKLAAIGPLADAPAEQMGCWTVDGLARDVVTPLAALREALAGRAEVTYAPGLPGARSTDTAGFAEAVAAARGADAVALFLGEDAGMSGEAHCRAFLDLPGAQAGLLEAVAAAGRPVVVVVMAGRALALPDVLAKSSAVLYAWHPGTMGGPALADLLLGAESPSGRLPVCLPRHVGQIPLYYAKRNTGRPARDEERGAPAGTPLDPKDFTSRYMDVEHTPLFPFGFGLTYSSFEYKELQLSSPAIGRDDALTASIRLTNTGRREAVEVVQLYVRDVAASLTRPVRELKDFQRVRLGPGESRRVEFVLRSSQLAFHGPDMKLRVEAGEFRLWIGPDAARGDSATFALTD